MNVYEAKSRLSALLVRVEAGEEIVIARNGRPVARLVPMRQHRSARVPGGWTGRVWMATDSIIRVDSTARWSMSCIGGSGRTPASPLRDRKAAARHQCSAVVAGR
ncbi:MAG: type II toxin-antitoxin system Phd/YefM family antitoxin [Geodermatophilaceae bacterium]